MSIKHNLITVCYPQLLQAKNCKSLKLYGTVSYVDGRHRHRYEVNLELVDELESAGLIFTGKDETGLRMEIVELPSHPFFIGVQFHLEFNSIPRKPSPLFEATGERVHSLSVKKLKERKPQIESQKIKAQRIAFTDRANGSAPPIYTNGNGIHC